MKEFLNHVNPHFQPESELLKKLEEKTLNYRVNELSELLSPGRKQESIYFIKEGVIRSHRILNGIEFTDWLFARGDIVLSLLSFVFNQASEVWLQVLANCDVIEIGKQDFLQLRSDFPQFREMTDLLIRDFLRRRDIHQFRLANMSALERYNLFLDECAYVNTRIQQKHIASFLGIRQDSLSRLRRNYLYSK